MALSGWQKTWVRILNTLLTLAMMLLIFFFSTESGEASDERSGIITEPIIRLTYTDYDRMNPHEQQIIYDNVSLVIRKLAHFTEYAMLGILLRLCLESWFGHRVRSEWTLAWISLAGGAFYAATDELHQILTDGRSGQFKDVLLDSCGVLLGVIIGTMIIRHTLAAGRNGG